MEVLSLVSDIPSKMPLSNKSDNVLMTSGGHLDVLRRMLFRILSVTLTFACIIFFFKKGTFSLLLAPTNSSFYTFKIIDALMDSLGWEFRFEPYDISLISTELSSQFMTHLTVSILLALLFASPYIVFELFLFISPALYEREKKYSSLVVVIIYLLFTLGLLMSYFVMFPISFHFLATYQVDDSVKSTITLDSYISTFSTLTFLMGIVFQLPVFAFILGKMGFIDAEILKQYRQYAFIVIMIIGAIITPPDIFTLILITIPIYGLYELSILVLKKWGTDTSQLS